MLQINGKIDDNDLAFVIERFGFPVVSMPCPVGKGNKINPHVSRFLMKTGERIDLFHIKPVYYETHDRKWRPLHEVLEHHGNTRMILKPDWDKKMHPRFLMWLIKRQALFQDGFISIPSPFKDDLVPLDFSKIYFTTSTFYPDPNPESTSVDGVSSQAQTTWAASHDATSGVSGGTVDDATADYISNAQHDGTFYRISRGFFLFDTSSIPDTDTIDSATASFYLTSTTNGDNDGQDYLSVITTSPASNTALVEDDYDQVGTTAQAPTLDIGSVTTSAYNDFVLNATGIANISKTGISKFGVREGHDIENVSIAGNSANNAVVRYADFAGTTNDPKLVVVHSAVATASTRRRFIRH